jgi:hypothetical protein
MSIGRFPWLLGQLLDDHPEPEREKSKRVRADADRSVEQLVCPTLTMSRRRGAERRGYRKRYACGGDSGVCWAATFVDRGHASCVLSRRLEEFDNIAIRIL